MSKKTTVALFAIFLGIVGGHKFYRGSWGWGIIFLVLWWTIFPAVIGLIEGLIYLTLSDDEFKKAYIDNPAPFKW